ncbi:zinc finger protein 668-like isoform X18 [Plodia interpunctella]|uniref:zinc finger protein 668-like isoform X18 n=1 Tax=Plodia interpunctella TaxID=58824 RepID=UPI002368ABE7|nr:zinc finger protein 668-like isoform X17 [Plodia interpunctella]
MAAKSSEWRPGPTVCRCCLTEGCYKDISTEYFWMGKREVYAEMLKETLEVTISYSKTGGPNSNSRLICEPCISRLRDATEFKRQVVECERVFMQHLDPGSTSLDIEVDSEPMEKIKIEGVKLEKSHSDDEEFGDRHFGDDDDDDDDDLDNQPLTKLASRVPKKESVDLLDLLDTSKPAQKRKSTVKVKPPPSKKAKTKIEAAKAKPSSSKAKPEKKKKDERYSYDPSRANAEIIIRDTTAYPFRVNDKSILCVYCQDLFDDPDVFRTHMDQEHAIFSLKVAFYNLPKSEFIKADLTNLKCRLCPEQFASLEAAAAHLTVTHNQNLTKNGKLGVMPYYLQKDVYTCAICEKSFPSLFHLNRHTITHFLSYVCHVCGSSYVASTGLLRHVRSKHQDYEVPCKKCGKKFPTMEAKEKHRRTEKQCMPYCCFKCNERFLDWKTRKRHMETAHGQSRKLYRCRECDLTFNNEGTYYDHFKLQHSTDCATCKHCGMKFLSLYRLKRHISKHSI